MAGWLPDPSEERFPKTCQVGFGLVQLFLVQMASSSEPAVLRLFYW